MGAQTGVRTLIRKQLQKFRSKVMETYRKQTKLSYIFKVASVFFLVFHSLDSKLYEDKEHVLHVYFYFLCACNWKSTDVCATKYPQQFLGN
jgi:hypothetical protein